MWGLLFASRKAARMSRVRKSGVGFAAVALCGGLLTQAAVADGSGTTPKQSSTTTPPGTVTWGGLNWGIGVAADFDVGGARVANATVVNGIVRVTDTSSNVDISFVLESHYFFALPSAGSSTGVFGKFEPPGGCQTSVSNTNITVNQSGTTATTQTTTTTKNTSQGAGTPGDSSLNYGCTEWAHGPFVAIEVGGGTSATPAANGPITGYAMGWMIGFRHPNAATSSNTSSWNFGFGLRVDPKAQVLGDGLVANQPLPAMDSIRYKTEPRPGIMLLSSFSF